MSESLTSSCFASIEDSNCTRANISFTIDHQMILLHNSFGITPWKCVSFFPSFLACSLSSWKSTWGRLHSSSAVYFRVTPYNHTGFYFKLMPTKCKTSPEQHNQPPNLFYLTRSMIFTGRFDFSRGWWRVYFYIQMDVWRIQIYLHVQIQNATLYYSSLCFDEVPDRLSKWIRIQYIAYKKA